MHMFQLQQLIRSLADLQEDFQPFFNALARLARSSDEFEATLQGLASPQLAHQTGINGHSYLASLRETLKTAPQRQIFKSLEEFKSAIHVLDPGITAKETLITRLDSEVEKFSALYDSFLSDHSAESALPLLFAAKGLNTKIHIFLSTLEFINYKIDTSNSVHPSEALFSLYLPAELNLSEFAKKLLAIQAMYTELCMLFSISEATYPLRISKIESGSVWLKVFGNMRVVEMMASFIENTASWLFRTYTTEGRLASIPRKVDAIDSLIELKKRMTDAGIDTVQMQEHIEKSAVKLSQSLTEIFDGESSVTVNDRTVSVGLERENGLLLSDRRLQLSDQVSTPAERPTEPPLLN